MERRLAGRRPILLAVTLVSIAAMVLAACGGDEEAQPAPAATATPGAAAPTPTRTPQRATPTPTRTPASPTATPTKAAASTPASQEDVKEGREIFLRAGCIACHKVTGVPGAVGVTGPDLTRVASIAASRVPGLSAEAYLRQSMLQPGAFVVKDYQPLMPSGLVAEKDVDDLVAFLLTLK